VQEQRQRHRPSLQPLRPRRHRSRLFNDFRWLESRRPDLRVLSTTFTTFLDRAPTASNTPPPQPDASGKPTSKLALLAQKRREAASKATSTEQSPSTTATPPLSCLRRLHLHPISPHPHLSSHCPSLPRRWPRHARREPILPLPSSHCRNQRRLRPCPRPQSMWQDLKRSQKTSCGRSPLYFGACPGVGLLQHPHDPCSGRCATKTAVIGQHAHRRPWGPSAAERRVREAFSPGVESPDDIVLRMRDGRAGTGAAVPPADQKSSKVEVVRAAKAAPALEPVSEVAAKAAEVEYTGKPAAGRSRGKATDSTKAKRPDASTKGSAGVGRQTSAAGKEPPPNSLRHPPVSRSPHQNLQQACSEAASRGFGC
jgi:elongation factor 1 alpha-like protein